MGVLVEKSIIYLLEGCLYGVVFAVNVVIVAFWAFCCLLEVSVKKNIVWRSGGCEKYESIILKVNNWLIL